MESNCLKLVIIGEPQSGKTTVLEFLKELYQELGVKSYELVEVHTKENFNNLNGFKSIRVWPPVGTPHDVGYWSNRVSPNYFIQNVTEFRLLKFQLRDLLINEILKK